MLDSEIAIESNQLECTTSDRSGTMTGQQCNQRYDQLYKVYRYRSLLHTMCEFLLGRCRAATRRDPAGKQRL